MKPICFLILFVALSFQGFTQKTVRGIDHDNKMINGKTNTLTFSNDIELIKPLINTNDSDGGYFKEYWGSAFQYMLCGAVITNSGTSAVTHVFLEMKIFSYNGYLHSYFSDTIPLLNPGETVTVNIPGEITFQPWISNTYLSDLQFIAGSDAVDENPGNNQQTVPFTLFSDWMWTLVSRSNTATTSFEIGQSTGFHSGDFIGFTLGAQSTYHWAAAGIEFYLYESCDSLVLRALLFRNERVIDSAEIYIDPPPSSGEWEFSNGFYSSIDPDSNYYICLKFYFPAGHSFKIGIDTSLYHNFNTESIARINNEWTSLPFVPVMRLVCDPEGIPEKDKTSPIVYPNPARDLITVDNVRDSEIGIYDFSGKILFSDKRTSSSIDIDVSRFSPGIYLLRITGKEGVITRKVIIE
jgi:hypothetical protein